MQQAQDQERVKVSDLAKGMTCIWIDRYIWTLCPQMDEQKEMSFFQSLPGAIDQPSPPIVHF